MKKVGVVVRRETLTFLKLRDERSASPLLQEKERAAEIQVALSEQAFARADSVSISEPSLFYYLSKRVLDISLALVGILVLLPVFLVIAVCIKLDDKGSILHFREIVGQHGKHFFALKFRTMIPDADNYLLQHPELRQHYLHNMKLMDDPRITRVGRAIRKASLDELPQLVNVLIGQMSLVGPRIIHPSELPRFGEFAQQRLSVKPGITGLWQISSRQHISYSERVRLDMAYIKTRSCSGDLIILLKTMKVLFVHTGV
jgi:lipopolysaccharide/colanic/teichoic acid biosynthesis glycosyltransferase